MALTTKGKELIWFFTLHALLGIGGGIAFTGFKTSQTLVDISNNPTPLGYTRSLILLLLPCATFGTWLFIYLKSPIRRLAFQLTLMILFPMGLLLDLLFGKMFLTFENSNAVLASVWDFCLLPAYDIRTGLAGFWGPGWSPFIPIEEVFFYLFGFTTILLTYIWSDHVVFGRHKVDESQSTPLVFRNGVWVIGFWSGVGGLLIAVAFVLRLIIVEDEPGFPGYFTFLVITAVVPSMICSRLAFHFVNWGALTLTWLFILFISQFWEASMAIPYGWWGYQKSQMIGIFIKPQCDLPIEAVLLWSLASWTTVMVYEAVLSVLRIRIQNPYRSIRAALQGKIEDILSLKKYYQFVTSRKEIEPSAGKQKEKGHAEGNEVSHTCQK